MRLRHTAAGSPDREISQAVVEANPRRRATPRPSASAMNCARQASTRAAKRPSVCRPSASSVSDRPPGVEANRLEHSRSSTGAVIALVMPTMYHSPVTCPRPSRACPRRRTAFPGRCPAGAVGRAGDQGAAARRSRGSRKIRGMLRKVTAPLMTNAVRSPMASPRAPTATADAEETTNTVDR